MKNSKGFTLIELVVVIVILGLLATVVTLNVMPSQDRAMVENMAMVYDEVRDRLASLGIMTGEEVAIMFVSGAAAMVMALRGFRQAGLRPAAPASPNQSTTTTRPSADTNAATISARG